MILKSLFTGIRGALIGAVALGLALGVAGALLGFAICCIWSPLLVRGIGVPLAMILAFAALADRAETRAA